MDVAFSELGIVTLMTTVVMDQMNLWTNVETVRVVKVGSSARQTTGVFRVGKCAMDKMTVVIIPMKNQTNVQHVILQVTSNVQTGVVFHSGGDVILTTTAETNQMKIHNSATHCSGNVQNLSFAVRTTNALLVGGNVTMTMTVEMDLMKKDVSIVHACWTSSDVKATIASMLCLFVTATKIVKMRRMK